MLAHCQACTAVQVLMLNLSSPLSQSAVPQIAKNNVKAASGQQMQLQGFMIGVPELLTGSSSRQSVCSASLMMLALSSCHCEGWQQTAEPPSW